jgi:undecaprenyl-diphosphatase
MQSVQPYLDYFSANPEWAIAVIFLIAFGEALLIIGLFVPSTLVLVGAGMLVGTGHLPFWPVFLATSIGAILGDQVSYWAGKFFGEHLKEMWPLNRYRQLVAKGEDFVRNHGGKSIAIGRFVPGVKAVVPGVVGMLGMSQLYFIIVNFSSGLFWAAAHVFPGMLLGQGLALAGDLSGRLVFVLIELLVILAVASWLIRLFVASASHRLSFALDRLSRWAKSRGSRSMHRFGRAVAPGNPRSMLIVFFAAIACLAFIGLSFMVISLVSRNTIPNGDLSVMTLMSELRNAPADQFMIPLTMLADGAVLWTLMAVMVAWLVWRRAWRAAAAAITVVFAGKLATLLLDHKVSAMQPLESFLSVDRFDFQSGHVAVTAIVFGVFAVLVSHAMGRWGRSLVVAISSLLVIAIAYSRIYLGVQWFSGAVAALLFAAVMVAAFGVAIEAIPPRRIRPLGLLVVSVAAFLIAGFVNIDRNLAKAESHYAPPQRIFALERASWLADGWQRLPRRRIDLAGRQEEALPVQWAGGLDELAQSLVSAGWQQQPKWTWKDSLKYIDLNAGIGSVAPRPALHEGLQARLTMTKANPDGAGRLVMRAYKTELAVTNGATTQPVFLVSLTEERLRRRFATYVIPVLAPASDQDIAGLRQVLASRTGVMVTQKQDAGITLYATP